MRILVCGGRDYRDRATVYAALDAVHRKTPVTLLIHGACLRKGNPSKLAGADFLADEWAASRGIQCHRERARWIEYGKAAGPIRNAAMLELKPDGVVAFPGGRGTADMVRQAEAAGVTVWRPVG